MKKELETKCELALMGKAVKVESQEDVQSMVEYITRVVNAKAPKDVLEDLNRYCEEGEENLVKYLVVNTIEDMVMVTLCLESSMEESDYPKPFEEDYGSGYPASFCYVVNLNYPEFSEFGDCFFEKRSDGYYHRVS